MQRVYIVEAWVRVEQIENGETKFTIGVFGEDGDLGGWVEYHDRSQVKCRFERAVNWISDTVKEDGSVAADYRVVMEIRERETGSAIVREEDE